MKKLLAMTAAFILALSMVACGSTDDDDDDESKAPKKSIATTLGGDSEAPADDKSEADKPADSPADEPEDTTTTTTTAEPEPEPEPEPQPAGENDFQGTGYSITVDPAKWTRGDDKNGVEAIWNNATNPLANFNVVSSDSGGVSTIDMLVAYGDQLKQQYEGYGYTVNTIEKSTFAGHDVLYAEIQAPKEVYGIAAKQCQYYFIGTGKIIIFTYTSTPDDFNTYLSDFTSVLETVKID
ncbi:MAG: hypothetical protein IKO44_00850 [Ruminococcus sp.]|nr:hypothetical protein [Ruminococcus sp.]